MGAVTRCLKKHNAGNATHPLAPNRTTHSDAQAAMHAHLSNRTSYVLDGKTNFTYKEHRPDKVGLLSSVGELSSPYPGSVP